MESTLSHPLHSPFEEAWANFYATCTAVLDIPANEMVFCGLAMGHADTRAQINAFVAERVTFQPLAIPAGGALIPTAPAGTALRLCRVQRIQAV